MTGEIVVAAALSATLLHWVGGVRVTLPTVLLLQVLADEYLLWVIRHCRLGRRSFLQELLDHVVGVLWLLGDLSRLLLLLGSVVVRGVLLLELDDLVVDLLSVVLLVSLATFQIECLLNGC